MKNSATITISWLFLFLFACSAQSQDATKGKSEPDKQETKSKLENFSSRSGILLEKKFVDIGKLGAVQIQTMTVTDIQSKQTTSGIRFEKLVGSGYTTRTVTAFIDADEVDGLLKSLKYFKNEIFPSTRNNYTEYIFDSRYLKVLAFQRCAARQ